MSYIDIIILVPLAIAAIRGFRKGFISELASILALVVGVLISMHFSYFLADLAISQGWVEEGNRMLAPISFLITFLAVVFCLNMVGNLVTSLLNVVALGLINRIAGAAFGVLKMFLLLAIALIAVDSFGKTKPIIPESLERDSALLEPMRDLATTVLPSLQRMIPWEDIPKSLEELEQAL